MFFQNKIKSAFSLIEVLVAVGIFSIFSVVMLKAALGAEFDLANSEETLAAKYLMQEAHEALLSIREYDWDNLTEGTFGLSSAAGYWELSGESDTVGNYSRQLVLSKNTPFEYDVTATVNWTNVEGIDRTLSSEFTLGFWDASYLVIDSQAEFDLGSFSNTESNAGGSVQLSALPSGWALPSIVDVEDISGMTDFYSLFVSGNYAYLGRQNDAGTTEFLIYNISSPSAVSLSGSLELSTTINDIYVSGNYAYLATADSAQELKVINVSSPSSPSLVGGLNMDNTGYALTVSGSYLYYAGAKVSGPGQEEFHLVNISTPTSPSLISSLEFGEDINDVIVINNYAYLATASNSQELAVVNIATPSSPSIYTSYNSTGSADANGIAYNSSDGTLHLALDVGTGSDYLILNIGSVSSPSLSLLGGLVTGANNMAVLINSAEAKAFLANDGSSEGFRVIDVSDTSTPVQDISFDLGGIGYDLASNGTNVFVASGSDTAEFVVFGSSGGAGGFETSGTYTSEKFDTGSTSMDPYVIEFSTSGTGTIQFQTRTANSAVGLDSATWVGPDGTASSYYTIDEEQLAVSPSASGTRQFQVRAYLSGSGSDTPILESIKISYEK